MRDKNPEPSYYPVPNYAPSPPAAVPHPEVRLSAAEEAQLEAVTFDELHDALRKLLDACYRQRRARRPLLTANTEVEVVRVNGLPTLAQRMTRGLRWPVDITAVPESALLCG